MKLSEYLETYYLLMEVATAMRDDEKASDVISLLTKAKEKGKKFSKQEIEKHLSAWGFSQGIIDRIVEKLDERGMIA